MTANFQRHATYLAMKTVWMRLQYVRPSLGSFLVDQKEKKKVDTGTHWLKVKQ